MPSTILRAAKLPRILIKTMRQSEQAGVSGLARDLSEAKTGGSRPSGSMTREDRAKLLRVLIACGAFALVLGVGGIMGLRAMIDVPQQKSDAMMEPNRISRSVITMPDGMYCKQVLYDNKTGLISESTTTPCTSLRTDLKTAPKEFSWGRN
jgi:hypothetical protein